MRALRSEAFKDLNSGILQPLKERVIKDQSLCLEFRKSKQISIYYRGGLMFNLTRNTRGGIYFRVKFCKRYFESSPYKFVHPSKSDIVYFYDSSFNCILYSSCQFCLSTKIVSESDIKDWIRIFPILKQTMDIHLVNRIITKAPLEKLWEQELHEIQQIMIRENNSELHDHCTDFIICDQDFRFKSPKKPEFNLVAAQLPPTHNSNLDDIKRRLVIIELVSEDTLVNNIDNLETRLDDKLNYLNKSNNLIELKKQMLRNFNQKRRLKIVNDIHKLDLFSNQKPMLIFAPIHLNPKSNKLQNTLKNLIIKGYSKNSTVEIFVAKSRLLGYRLFNNSILTIQDALKYFKANPGDSRNS